MHLQIIVGSVREGRVSLPVAEWARQEASARNDFTVELVDLKTWNLPMFALRKPPILGGYEDETQRRWARNVSRADAFLFITPEYNHSFTPALKNALDYLYGEWNRKPAAFISFGQALGARAIEQLSLVLLELRMVPLAQAIQLRDVHSRIKNDRFVADPQDATRLHRALDELAWWTTALKSARETPAQRSSRENQSNPHVGERGGYANATH
jgi:NAD(P)H-dependent FMN reductase